MRPDDLLSVADDLISTRSRKPRQSNLRRAVSTAYYAMFHCLARCCADTLVGSRSADRSRPAWRQVYRALEHGFAKNSCRNQTIIKRFPKDIEDFANTFVSLQEKRHLADYDPFSQFTKLEVNSDIAATRDAIERFKSVPIKDRRAFAVFVLFKDSSRPIAEFRLGRWDCPEWAGQGAQRFPVLPRIRGRSRAPRSGARPQSGRPRGWH